MATKDSEDPSSLEELDHRMSDDEYTLLHEGLNEASEKNVTIDPEKEMKEIDEAMQRGMTKNANRRSKNGKKLQKTKPLQGKVTKSKKRSREEAPKRGAPVSSLASSTSEARARSSSPDHFV